MKGKLLITASLLDAFRWYVQCPPAWKQKAYNSFVAKLRREPYTPHKNASKGAHFENAVANECVKPTGTGSVYFQHVVDMCKGKTYQPVYKKVLEIDGTEYLVYCKLDFYAKDHIVDIKTVTNYKNNQKYLSGNQHFLYPFATGTADFTYLVVQFESDDSPVIKAVHEIHSKVDDFRALKLHVTQRIQTMVDFINRENLYEDYYTTFSNN